MKYRKLDTDGDMLFGHGHADYLQNSPECVAQAVATRLRLLRGEWFLDLTEGTPYAPAIMGKHTKSTYDFAIRERVLETEGVTGIDEYQSIFDGETRTLTVNIRISTNYGQMTLQEIF